MGKLTTMVFDGTRTMNEHILEMTNLVSKFRALEMQLDGAVIV